MTPGYGQESVATFSVEDWLTVPVEEDGIFTECRPLDFARKQVPNWPQAMLELIGSDADRDIQAGRVAIFDSLGKMLASLKNRP